MSRLPTITKSRLILCCDCFIFPKAQEALEDVTPRPMVCLSENSLPTLRKTQQYKARCCCPLQSPAGGRSPPSSCAGSAGWDGPAGVPALGPRQPSIPPDAFSEAAESKMPSFPELRITRAQSPAVVAVPRALCPRAQRGSAAQGLAGAASAAGRGGLERTSAATSAQTGTSPLAHSYTYQQKAKVKYNHYCYYLLDTVSSCLFTKALLQDKAALASETQLTRFSAGLCSCTARGHVFSRRGAEDPKGSHVPRPRGNMRLFPKALHCGLL